MYIYIYMVVVLCMYIMSPVPGSLPLRRSRRNDPATEGCKAAATRAGAACCKVGWVPVLGLRIAWKRDALCSLVNVHMITQATTKAAAQYHSSWIYTA